MNCPICGSEYVLGQPLHANCERIRNERAERDKEINSMLSWWKNLQKQQPSQQSAVTDVNSLYLKIVGLLHDLYDGINYDETGSAWILVDENLLFRLTDLVESTRPDSLYDGLDSWEF